MKWIVARREVSIAQEEFSRRELASAFQANYAVKSIAPFYPQKPQGNGAFNFTSDMSIMLPNMLFVFLLGPTERPIPFRLHA